LVVTPAMDTRLPSEFRDYALRVGRSPRLGRPDDIAGMVAFLVSDDGEWVNGQVLSVDGGASMRP
jgi:NAD(P)-dependent dehydrogenase (short-subunit alcohol dehydrogenase family)